MGNGRFLKTVDNPYVTIYKLFHAKVYQHAEL